MKNSTAKTINEYLDGLPEKEMIALHRLRKTIKSIAPKAEEIISYQIPVFKYYYSLVGFAAFKNHCSFFVMSKAVMKKFKEDLKSYRTATATIHFTVEKPLPATLVKRIIKARMKENEARFEIKQLPKAIAKIGLAVTNKRDKSKNKINLK